jgi:hypothetical protein
MKQGSRTRTALVAFALAALLSLAYSGIAAAKSSARGTHRAKATRVLKPRKYGGLDCNGYSRRQKPVRRFALCTDVQGVKGAHNRNTWNGRFIDNGHYIGHDEPDMGFYSSRPGSGSDVTWTETLGSDPGAPPTVSSPGHDVTHWFELSVAPWFSMDVCDPDSYPYNPCTPESDRNAPTCAGPHVVTAKCFPGAGDAFVEMQFYPPGEPPFIDSISCDDTHWCAALTIDSLECSAGYAVCNGNCQEPVNFAWIQHDGVPTGPPSPQESNYDSSTPNRQTLLMNPGDTITVHMFDAPVRVGGGKALEVQIYDWTTHQSGFMQASAKNGFAHTDPQTCNGTPFNFEPEFNTAKPGNVTSWAALRTNISTQFEIGHWEACTSLSQPLTFTFSNGFTDTTWNQCSGPYESSGGDETLEPGGDGPCYPQGDTHGQLNTAPDEATGCLASFSGGDLDFDGQPYYADWPTSASPTATLPASFVQQLPMSRGSGYSQYQIQTDVAYSEASCSVGNPAGCTVPPAGPGGFYPFWSFVQNQRGWGDGTQSANANGSHGGCTIEFGNVTSGPGVNDLGGDAQYGTDQAQRLGAPEFQGPIVPISCGSRGR